MIWLNDLKITVPRNMNIKYVAIFFYVLNTSDHSAINIYIYIYIYKVKVKFATVVEGDPKAPFSIATTPRCTGWCYSFPSIVHSYP